MSIIRLENMEFFAYHGCYHEEQIIGNRFLVNMEITAQTRLAEESDRLSDTINYQRVHELIREQMKQKSHLLEHIGRRILTAVRAEFPEAGKLRLKISKMNPPMGGKMDCVSLELEDPEVVSKKCPRCGAAFECLHTADCWCTDYSLSTEALSELNRLYADCLCPACLQKIANEPLKL